MKLRNVSGYPLDIRKYRRVVGPGEVVDTDELGHDMATDGVITGFEPVEDEPKQDEAPQQSGKQKTRNARSGGDGDGEQK